MVERFVKNGSRQWIGVVVLGFALVYLLSLTFTYVEGDDALSIAYHLYDRNSSIQTPYSTYHSMMDRVLGFLPVNEALLRTTAIALTSFAGVGIVLLMLAIIFDWFQTAALAPKWIIALAVLLASPEFFYLGLVYLPGVIAMALVLSAHLILRRGADAGEPPSLSTARGRVAILLSAIVFGVGAACRWDITVYGAVIAADLLFGYGNRAERLVAMIRRRWMTCVGWGVLALVCFFLAIIVSGYAPATILSQLRGYQEYAEGRGLRLDETLGTLQTLVTPAFGLFVLIGFIALLRRRDPLLLVIGVGLVVILPWASRGVPKFILPGIPGLVACAVVGFSAVWSQFQPRRWQLPARVVTALLLLAPWLIGVQLVFGDSAWGPGFELRPYDRPDPGRTRVSLAVFGPGTLIPSSEGPRGLFGHAAVLLGGGWRDAVTQRWAELENATDYVLANDLPLISTGNSGNFVVLLWLRGYSTQDPRNPSGTRQGGEELIRRDFTNAQGDSLVMYNREIDSTQIQRLGVLPAEIDEIGIYGYPRTLRELYLEAPQALVEKLGPLSAVLDMTQLRPIIESQG
jgi:hypothetical protein